MAKINTDKQFEDIFKRLRNIELLISFTLGTIFIGGGSIAAKVFGFLK